MAVLQRELAAAGFSAVAEGATTATTTATAAGARSGG
jgi:hypothetical protein